MHAGTPAAKPGPGWMKHHEEAVKYPEEGKHDEETIHEAIRLKRRQLADALGIHRAWTRVETEGPP